MAGPIVGYWASVGVRTDDKDLKKVDDYLKKIENRLAKSTGKKGLSVNLYIDEAKFHKHLQGVMKRVGKSSPLKLSNVTIDPATLSKSIRDTLGKANFRAPIQAVLSRASLTTLRAQVAGALQGLPVNVRVGNVSRSGGGNRGDGSESARRRASLTGRGDPSLMEQWMGKTGKSSLSAGPRRYYDAMVGKALGGVGGNSLTGMAIQGGFGGLARAGSGSLMGRMVASAGMTLGGAFGGTMGLVGSGIISMAGQAFTGIWSTLGKVITLPFQAISGAASMVTGAFYRIALAAIPLVAGFNVVNKNVQQVTSRNIALDTTAGRFGSNATTEKKWLMDMANREGMSYSTMIDPYTSYMAAAAPTLGIEKTRSAFEAFNQYGSTHGATKESSGRALYAFSQMASKGTIMSEELNQQLAEATGFSGMKGLVAEAYQMKLGKNQSNMLKGDKAITALTDAMKKGAVKTAELIPFLDGLMRRDAAPGLAVARNSAQAAQNRFETRISKGWDNFTKGGGESGLRSFWVMMQKFGDWWIANGDSLGRMFHATMIGLDAFRLSVMEMWQFITKGEHNSITDWARSLGIDVDAIRDALLRLRDSVLKLLGIDSNNVGTILETIIERLITFINNLQHIADGATRVVEGVGQVKQATVDKNQTYLSQGLWGRTKMFTEEALRNVAALTPFGRIVNANKPSVFGGIGEIIGGTKDATSAAAGALYNLGTGAGGKAAPLSPSTPTWKPEGWGTTPADIGNAPTRRSDFAPQQVNHNVKLEVTGNAEIIGALMDEKSKQTFPVLFSQELTKALVQAPKQ